MNDDQRRLTMRHLKMARCLAARMARTRPDVFDDLESAAFLALVEAVQAYDSSRSNRFTTFAYERIQGALADFQRDLFSGGGRGETARLPKFQQFESGSEERGRVVGAESDEPVGAELERAEEIEIQLNKLPSLHATAIRHICFDGKTQEETASLVGCSKASMSRIYNEAIAWLHQTAGSASPSASPDTDAESAPLNRRKQLQNVWSARSKAQPRPVFSVAV